MIDFLVEVAAWFADPEQWSGPRGIPTLMADHVQISALTVGLAALIAIPAGALLGHSDRGDALAVTVVNIGRAIPSFAVVAVALPFSIRLGLGIGYWPTFLALFLLALPPMFTNAVAGVREVERAAVEAARGLGMREREILLRIELPIALPVILAAVRVSAVQVVATATLGAVIGWGGLGRLIIDGFAVQDNVRIFAGALLVAALAIAVEGAFVIVERRLLPEGVRALAGHADVPPVGDAGVGDRRALGGAPADT